MIRKDRINEEVKKENEKLRKCREDKMVKMVREGGRKKKGLNGRKISLGI